MVNDFFSNDEKNKYVKGYLEKRLSQYGEISYVYAVMNKKDIDKMMIISNLPECLVANYLENKMQRIDPVIQNALNRVTSFFWDENLKINERWTVKRVFEPVKTYNIVSGYAFILHDHNKNLAILSLYIDKHLMVATNKIIEKNKNDLQALLICIHDVLIRIYCQNERTHIKSPQVYCGLNP